MSKLIVNREMQAVFLEVFDASVAKPGGVYLIGELSKHNRLRGGS